MKTDFRKVIGLFTLFAASLLAYRLLKSESLSYIFLAWNVFLAFIPYWISSFLKKTNKLTLKHLPLLGLWLLFLPNAPYILTDLFHLKLRPGIPLWFDLVLVSSFALVGFVLFYRSLTDVLRLLRKQVDAFYINLAPPLVFGLTAFGLYLGRVLRFNSWDIVQHPFRLAKASARTLLCKDAIGFVIVFTAFMWLIYMTMEAFSSQSKKEA